MKLKPRDYQVEAAEWALRRGKAVVCMPTGTGKTLVAILWMKHLLEEGLARKILVLEPTRYLVEQTARYMREVGGLNARPVHGSLSPGLRRSGWQAEVVVATPEIVVAEWETFISQRFDAIVVDECHHTTGQDAYRVVVEGYDFKWRLGLTAYIPPSRKRVVEDSIGEVRCWSWDDPRLAKYVPPWEAEVYEAQLNSAEEKLYHKLEELWEQVEGRDRGLVQMAIRWFVRDGAAALRESVTNSEKLAKLVEPVKDLLYSGAVRPAHKLDALIRVLADHEGFDKAIVFVDRVIVARLVAEELGKRRNVVLLVGRRHGTHPSIVLEKAHSPETKIIVSTSAGEEGIDLPEASLLIVWSHTASPLRFIQRHGRLLRATGQRRLKWVVYIVTPETIDVDSLVDSLLEARRAGIAVNIDPGIVEYVWSLSRRRRILELLEEKPLDEEMIARVLEMPLPRVKEALEWLVKRDLAVYIYTVYGKVYAAKHVLDKLYNSYREYLEPDEDIDATITVTLPSGKTRSLRGKYDGVRERLRRLLAREGYFERLRASVMVRVSQGLIRLVQFTYTYRIDNDVLDIVVRNIYSAAKVKGLK